MDGLVLPVAWLLLPVLAVTGIVVAALGARGGRTTAIWALAQAAGMAVATLALVLYVSSEDDYRADGTSRWDAYGAQEVTVAAVAVGVTAVVLLGLATLLRRRGLGMGGSLLSTAAAVLVFFAIFANSLN